MARIIKYKHLIFFIVSVGLFIGIILANIGSANLPKAKEGVFTVQGWDFYSDGNMKLHGEWAFYWDTLISPDLLKNNKVMLSPSYINVPDSWFKGDEKTERLGSGTYHLKVVFKGNLSQKLKFYTKFIFSAGAVYVDGKRVMYNGKPDIDSETYIPSEKTYSLAFEPKNNSIDIVVHASNYSLLRSGLVNNLWMGYEENIDKTIQQRITFEAFVLASLVIISIYHLFLFFYRRKDKSTLFFALACICISGNLIINGEQVLNLFFDVNYSLYWVFKFTIMYGIPATFFYYIHYLFPRQAPSLFGKIITSLSLILLLLSIALPVDYTYYFVATFRYILLLSAFYMFFIIIKAVVNKESDALTFLTGFSILVIAMVNDVLYHAEIIDTTDMTAIGLLIFFIMHSSMISIRFSKSFRLSEKLTEDMRIINDNLLSIVDERTQSIEKQKIELVDAYSRLKNLTEFKEDVTNMVIHDLKTPINTILYYTDKEDVKKAGWRMLNLVNHVLDIQRYTSGDFKANPSLTNLNSIIEKATDHVSSMLKEKNIELKKHIHHHVEVYVDPTQLERIIENVLNNAVKFSHANSEITIGVKEAERINDEILIYVADKGKGIPQDEIKYIFDKYSAFSDSPEQNKLSTGLGLTFCKLAIEANNGKIWVESKVGQGTVFWLSIPLANQEFTNEIGPMDIADSGDNFKLDKEQSDLLLPIFKTMLHFNIYQASAIRKEINKLYVIKNIEIDKIAKELEDCLFNQNTKRYEDILRKFTG